MNESRCKGCGAIIVWAETNHGKNVPLDPRAIVYSVVMEKGKLVAVKPTPGIVGEQFMVSHFNTCSKANDFSGSKKQEQPPYPARDYSEPATAE